MPSQTQVQVSQTTECPLPTRRFLRLEEAAAFLGVCVDTFKGIGIPRCKLTRKISVWDVEVIVSYVHNGRCDDSARTSATEMQRRRRLCEFTEGKARRIGGSHGTAGTEDAIAEVLELTTELFDDLVQGIDGRDHPRLIIVAGRGVQ